MPTPNPTPIYRIIHVESLDTHLQRDGLHAPNFVPNDNLPIRQIHNESVQARRRDVQLTCGPRGSIHDYVPFYFGYKSVMLLNHKSGRVPGNNDGQRPIIYLKTTAQEVARTDGRFVFSDGHGLQAITNWFDNLDQLANVDWSLVNAQYWFDTPKDPDRKRRKQAEFLIWQRCDWNLVSEIGVLNASIMARVEEILGRYPNRHRPAVNVRTEWYY